MLVIHLSAFAFISLSLVLAQANTVRLVFTYRLRKIVCATPNTLVIINGYLFQKMLIYDPALRMTAKEALEHPYFANLDKSVLPSNTC